MARRLIRIRMCAGAATLLVGLSACGDAGGAAKHVPPSPSSIPLPAVAREAVRPDPNFDYGFVVQITPGGFHPNWLVAACCKPITWKNATPGTISVTFDALRIDSGPIPPGGTFAYTPANVESIAYHSGNDPSVSAVVQVNPAAEP